MTPEQLEKRVASLFQQANQTGDYKAIAELLVEYTEPGVIPTDIMSLLLNTRALNEGDSLVKKFREGMKVHTYVPGSIHPLSEVTVRDNIVYNLDGAHLAVTFNEDELRNGDIGTLESMRRQMRNTIQNFFMTKVFNALASVWTISNNFDFYTSVGGALNASDLKSAIDNVNINSGGVRAVVGTRAALTPITTFGAGWDIGSGDFDRWAVNSNLEEIMRTGWLGVYYGAPIVAIDQVYDNPADYNEMIPSDKVLVLGQSVGEFITYGGMKTDEYVDKRFTPSQWVLKQWTSFGMVVDNAQGIHVLGDITPV